MKKIILFSFIAFIVVTTSCKKGPGEGGKANITGKVWEERWIGAFHDSTNDHWSMEQDIYIIYGSDLVYGNRTKTGPEGLYEFQYLRSGEYTVYFYSDSTVNLKKAIKRVVSIPRNGTTDLGTDTIKKIN